MHSIFRLRGAQRAGWVGFGVPLAVECLAGGVSHERRCTTILIDGHQGMMVAGSDRDGSVGGDGGYEAGFTDLNQALVA